MPDPITPTPVDPQTPATPATPATPDTPATPAVAPATPETPATPAAPAAPAAPTQADFRSLLTDPAHVDYASRFTDLPSIIDGALELKRQVSDGSRIKVPGADATEEDLGKFRKAIGAAETTEDYKIAAPEGYEWTEVDQQFLDIAAPIALKHNIPVAAFEGLVQEHVQSMVDLEKTVLSQLAEQHEANKAALDKEWGADKEKNYSLANRFAQLMGEDFNNILNSVEVPGKGLLGDQPEVVKALAKMGRKISEADLSIVPDADAQKTAKERIAEIRAANPAGSAGYKAHEKELQELYGVVYGNQSVVGASDRTS